MQPFTSEQSDKVVALIGSILGPEYLLEIIPPRVEKGFLVIEVITPFKAEPISGGYSVETFVRAACWLAARQTVWGLRYVDVQIITNEKSRCPSGTEMALANAREVYMDKARAAEVASESKAIDLTPQYRRYWETVSGLTD